MKQRWVIRVGSAPNYAYADYDGNDTPNKSEAKLFDEKSQAIKEAKNWLIETRIEKV